MNKAKNRPLETIFDGGRGTSLASDVPCLDSPPQSAFGGMRAGREPRTEYAKPSRFPEWLLLVGVPGLEPGTFTLSV
jgi:hypothetical protein